MKPILVTGSSGYIGSHLCRMLIERGYQVIGLDYRIPTGKVDYGYYSLDIANDERAIRDIYHQDYDFCTVVHLAALTRVGESTRFPSKYYDTNVIGTRNLLKYLSYDHFIFASTGQASLMGNPYAISKRVAEDMVIDTCTTQNVDYTAFRFYNVVGSDGFYPSNPDALLYNLIDAAEENKKFTIFGNDYDTPDGTCVRDYVHVLDICESICRAIEKPANSVENLGTGRGSTVLEIVNTFKRVNGVDFEVEFGPRRPGDIPVSVLDNPSSYFQSNRSMEDLFRLISTD